MHTQRGGTEKNVGNTDNDIAGWSANMTKERQGAVM